MKSADYDNRALHLVLADYLRTKDGSDDVAGEMLSVPFADTDESLSRFATKVREFAKKGYLPQEVLCYSVDFAAYWHSLTAGEASRLEEARESLDQYYKHEQEKTPARAVALRAAILELERRVTIRILGKWGFGELASSLEKDPEGYLAIVNMGARALSQEPVQFGYWSHDEQGAKLANDFQPETARRVENSIPVQVQSRRTKGDKTVRSDVAISDALRGIINVLSPANREKVLKFASSLLSEQLAER